MKDAVSDCPIEAAMQVLGGRWRTLLIYYLKDGPKRFGELRRDNPGISHRMLTLGLRELEMAGVVTRTVYPEVPPKVEYALTEAGHQLMPVIDALGDWWESTQTKRLAAE